MAGKWLFVINPAAGKKRHSDIAGIIRAALQGRITFEIMEWDQRLEFSVIEGQLQNNLYSTVIAVGGDGTVNRVASMLVGSSLRFGVIATGSGNGFARSLALSMDPGVAIQQLMAGNVQRIDTGTVNGRPFFCTSGVGFDAHIGGLFANSASRGLRSYVKLVLKELARYRSQRYTVRVGGQELSLPAFLITVANAGQYGNDFFIAPGADLQDGQFHVVVMRPFSLIKAPGILRRIMARQAHLSPSIYTCTGTHIEIIRQEPGPIHFDGEPVMEDAVLVFDIHPGSLQVLAGPGFKAG